ncbi:MAG: hypothetical protein HEEMFOPI_01587 [Holosporales bacterium]
MVFVNTPLKRPYMQVISLPKSIYKLYQYARSQECLDDYHTRYEDLVKKYQLLRDEDIDHKTCYILSGISRATFYRYKKILEDLKKGIKPSSKKPKHVR